MQTHTPWQEFIEKIDKNHELEYGDFKREVDAHLRRLIESAPPLNDEQVREIVQIRLDYLWSDHGDEEIERIKKDLRQRIQRISELH